MQVEKTIPEEIKISDILEFVLQLSALAAEVSEDKITGTFGE